MPSEARGGRAEQGADRKRMFGGSFGVECSFFWCKSVKCSFFWCKKLLVWVRLLQEGFGSLGRHEAAFSLTVRWEGARCLTPLLGNLLLKQQWAQLLLLAVLHGAWIAPGVLMAHQGAGHAQQTFLCSHASQKPCLVAPGPPEAENWTLWTPLDVPKSPWTSCWSCRGAQRVPGGCFWGQGCCLLLRAVTSLPS